MKHDYVYITRQIASFYTIHQPPLPPSPPRILFLFTGRRVQLHLFGRLFYFVSLRHAVTATWDELTNFLLFDG